jgi:sulfofructosephosphate aldolase
MTLAAIARPSGALAMVAMDQRESLREMFVRARGTNVPGSTLVDFKLAVAEELSPYASALLLDNEFGSVAMRRVQCALIVAADALEYGAPGVVADTRFDRSALRATNAVAAKLLVIWRRDAQRLRRVAMTRDFVRACHAVKLLAIVEGVVRRDDDDLQLEAARELAACGPDVYKAEVPGFGKAPLDETARRCEAITRNVDVPWVVLSAGVALDDFPRAVEAACRGGASGFLAGRAIWSDAVGASDVRAALREQSAPRLQRLGDLVDRFAQARVVRGSSAGS